MADGGHVAEIAFLVEYASIAGFATELAIVAEYTSIGAFVPELSVLVDYHSEWGDFTELAIVAEYHVEALHVAEIAILYEGVIQTSVVSETAVLVEYNEEKSRITEASVLVEYLCSACLEAVVSETSILVEYDGFVRPAVSDINIKATNLISRIESAEINFRGLLDTGLATQQDLFAFQVVITGFRSEIATCRNDLDPIIVTQALIYESPADFINLLQWERGLRLQLIRIDGGLRTQFEILDELVIGQPGKVVVVRSGETFQSIAQREIGNFEDWRLISAANPSVEVGILTAGTILIIPEVE